MLSRLWWFWKCDRLGPDIPLTHILLYFHRSSRWVCRKKFKRFGKGSEFRPFAFAHYPSRISIGNNVKIHPGTVLSANPMPGGSIVIEDDVGIGHNVHIYPANHKYDRTDVPVKYQGYYSRKDILVCKGSWIGANVTILAGVTIGEHSVVGAGAVVTKDVPQYTVVAGNPAVVIKRLSGE